MERIIVNVADRTYKFVKGSSRDILEYLADEVGPCENNRSFLLSPEGMVFATETALEPGNYSYTPKELKPERYDPHFGYLVAPSSQNYQTVREIQFDPIKRNLNFRPANATPFLPLQLVNKVFADFLESVSHLELFKPSKDDYDFFEKLAVESSALLETEGNFRVALKQAYTDYFAHEIHFSQEHFTGNLHHHGTATDIGANCAGALFFLKELKKSVAGASADLQMQGIGNYKLHWTRAEPEKRQQLSDTAYPAFLAEHVGQWLKIGGLVTLAGKVCFQPLASVDLFPIHGFDYSMAERGVRTLMALRKALLELNDYYVGKLSGWPVQDQLFTKIPYMLHEYGDTVKQVGERLVYIVRSSFSEKYPYPVVVKFVQGYGFAVHKAWSKAGFAAKLYCKSAKLGGWFAVIMEPLLEEDGWICMAQLDAEKADNLRPSVLEALENAHNVRVDGTVETPLFGVHGDMRDDNVMVKFSDGILEVKFIDFDWANVESMDSAVYPGFMNGLINWSDGVEEGKPMLRVHDKELLQRNRKEQYKSSKPRRKRSKGNNVFMETLEEV